MKDIFTKTYEQQWWGLGQGSGIGSSATATKLYRKLLEDVLQKQQVKSVLDLGCGDWRFSQLVHWGDVSYTGIDVVPHVVQKLRNKFNKPNWQFIEADITTCELPPADLVLIKDVMQHWPNDTIKTFLPKLKAYKTVLITNTVELKMPKNRDIGIGGYRPLDIRKSPIWAKCEEMLLFWAVENDLKLVLKLL